MTASFSGFASDDLAFLTGLAANNDRDWFTANRAAYDNGLKPALSALIEATSSACAARGVPLSGDGKKSVFRIHRDVRFSKDKRPYKTHISATLTRDGAKMSPGMMYVHIEPDGGSRPRFDPDSIDPLDPSTHPSAAAPAANEGEVLFGDGPFGEQFRFSHSDGKQRSGVPYLAYRIVACDTVPRLYRGISDSNGRTGYVASPPSDSGIPA